VRATATAVRHWPAQARGAGPCTLSEERLCKNDNGALDQSERDFKKLSNNGLTRTWRPIRSIADGNIGAASCHRCARGAKVGRNTRASKREPQVLPPAIPVALAVTLLHAAADTVPTLNIEPGCRAAAKMGDQLSLDTTLRQCLADERGARNELENKWAQFPPALRQRCLATTETGNPSYVEVLVCLQMGQDAAELDKPSSARK
jgi:hypothetical protein